MCMRYIAHPGAHSIAPRRLQMILEKIGNPWILRTDDVVLADHTLEMIRIAYDTMSVRTGVWKKTDTSCHADFDGKGDVMISYMKYTFKELTGLEFEDSELRDELCDVIALFIKLTSRLPLTSLEYNNLNEFLKAFVSYLHELSAHH